MDNSNNSNLEHYLETYFFLKTRLPWGFKIYNYSGSYLEYYYHNLYEFIYTNIKEKWNDFDINPCYFYYIEEGFLNGKPVKAYAEPGKEFNVIGISYELFERLKKFIDLNFKILNENSVLNKNIGKYIDISANDLIYQASMQFIYFHELAHIIQNSNTLIFISEEKNDNIDAYNDIVKSHVMETDADLFAANLVADHLIGFWNRLDSSNYPVNVLEDMISLSLVGIFLTFDYLSGGIRPFYTLATSHPHEASRITLVSGVINDRINMSKTINVDREKTTRKTFQILFEFKKDTTINRYLGMLKSFNSQISAYSRFIRDEGNKHPNLASFKMVERNNKNK
jgi:hypothetical protein